LYPDKPVHIDSAVYENRNVFCLKNDMGKVVKPATHPKVVLDIHVPYKFGGVKP
jgi:hypothetical protein